MQDVHSINYGTYIKTRTYKQITMHSNKILYKYQFVFRKSYSTNHAIISLAEKVNNSMDSGKISIGVFLDLRKAFDTVDH